MNVLEYLKQKLRRRIEVAKDEHTARQEKAESDTAADRHVAGSRANVDGQDGSYVGRTSPQYDAEVQQSGAEARSEAARHSRDKSE